MVKDSISKDMAAETVRHVSNVSGKTVELVRTNALSMGSAIRTRMNRIEKLTKEHSELTMVSVGLALLCSGMFGLWFTILTRTGI